MAKRDKKAKPVAGNRLWVLLSRTPDYKIKEAVQLPQAILKKPKYVKKKAR